MAGFEGRADSAGGFDGRSASAAPPVPAAAQEGALTITQAFQTVQARVTVLVATKIAEQRPAVDALVTKAKDTKLVTTEEACEAVAVDRKALVRKRAALEEERKSMTRLLDDLKKLIKGPFDELQGELDAQNEHLRKMVEPYLIEKDRKEQERLAEERRVQQQLREAAEKEEREKREEADRLQRDADEKARLAAQATGFEKRELEQAATDAAVRSTEATMEATIASEVRELAEQPVDLRAQSVAARAVTGETIGLAGVWVHELEDWAKVPDEYKQLNDALIKTRYSNDAARKAIAGPDGQPTIPGLRIYQKKKVR